MNKSIPKFVITGGPCGGKTTAIPYLEQELGDRGIHVFTVPELATQFMSTGITPESIGSAAFQQLLFTHSFEREATYSKAATLSRSKKKVILCDRGICDGLAYMRYQEFRKMLTAHKESLISVRDGRYDAVFHLVTAAIGAENHYTRLNNVVRKESPKAAAKLDMATRKAWNGHPHLRIIDNSTDFPKKCARLLKEVTTALGLPVPTEIERKFVIKPIAIDKIPVPIQHVRIEQTYLHTPDPGIELRIRRRSQFGSSLYYLTKKSPSNGFARLEYETRISEAEYFSRFADRDLSRLTIVKDRYCFEWMGLYFELDKYQGSRSGLFILEIELTDQNDNVEWPSFLHVIKEVTDTPKYSNRMLALKISH